MCSNGSLWCHPLKKSCFSTIHTDVFIHHDAACYEDVDISLWETVHNSYYEEVDTKSCQTRTVHPSQTKNAEGIEMTVCTLCVPMLYMYTCTALMIMERKIEMASKVALCNRWRFTTSTIIHIMSTQQE